MDRIVSGITEYKKNKYKVCMDDGTHLVLYKGEVRRYRLQEGQTVDEALYQELFYEVVGKRVKKRALALLEKMDRTEQGLYRKLAESEYPEELILDAIEYVKKYHYIDDMRYARNYISYRQGSKSRRRLQQELMQKGVPKEITEQALEEIYENNDIEKIAEILAGYNIYIQAGNATTIETLTIIDGGTATSEDLLSFSGGSSLD